MRVGPWCFLMYLAVETRRTARDPFLGLKRLNVAADRRRVRRAFTPEEMARLLAAARACENHVYVVSSTYTDPSSKWMISAVFVFKTS